VSIPTDEAWLTNLCSIVTGGRLPSYPPVTTEQDTESAVTAKNKRQQQRTHGIHFLDEKSILEELRDNPTSIIS
jgi:hypothetical protein